MNNLLHFLAKLKTKQISISLDDSFENLRIRGDLKNLTPLDKQDIIENKADLISFLKDRIRFNLSFYEGILKISACMKIYYFG